MIGSIKSKKDLENLSKKSVVLILSTEHCVNCRSFKNLLEKKLPDYSGNYTFWSVDMMVPEVFDSFPDVKSVPEVRIYNSFSPGAEPDARVTTVSKLMEVVS